VTVRGTLADAWLLYRLLLRRSLVVALAVYALIFGAQEAARLSSHHHFAIGLVSFALGVAGPLLVQGALIELVQDVHVGNLPASVLELFRRTRPRILALVGGSLLYGLLVVVGLVLLVIPGLYALARLSLIVPVLVLERRTVFEALDRSSAIVRGSSIRVLGVLLISFVVESAPGLIDDALGSRGVGLAFDFVLTVLLAPYLAHLLSAIYYRLTDTDKPLISPALAGSSVWEPQPGGPP
jgi:hypothetical protein